MHVHVHVRVFSVFYSLEYSILQGESGLHKKSHIARPGLVSSYDTVRSCDTIRIDGEVARENYVHYHCRHLKGISFDTLTEGPTRNARAVKAMPTIVGKVEAGEAFLVEDWKRAQGIDVPTVCVLWGSCSHYELSQLLAKSKQTRPSC